MHVNLWIRKHLCLLVDGFVFYFSVECLYFWREIIFILKSDIASCVALPVDVSILWEGIDILFRNLWLTFSVGYVDDFGQPKL